MGGRIWWYFQLFLVLCIFMSIGALLAEAFDSFDIIENFGGACARSLTQIKTLGFHQAVVMIVLAIGFYGAGSRGKGLTVASIRDLLSLLLFGAFVPVFMINSGAFNVWSLIEAGETLSFFYLATFLTTVLLVGMASFGGLLESDKVAFRSLGTIFAIILIGHIPSFVDGNMWHSLISFFMDLACINLLCVLLKIVFFPTPILGSNIENKSLLFLLALLIIVIGVPIAGATIAVIYGGLYWLVFCLPAQLLWNGGAAISFDGPFVAQISHVILPSAYIVYVFECSIVRGLFFLLAIFKSMSDFGENYAGQIRERNIEALSEAANEEFEVTKVQPRAAIIVLGLIASSLVLWWTIEVIDDSTLSPHTLGRKSSGFSAVTGRSPMKEFVQYDEQSDETPRTSWRIFSSLLVLDGNNYNQQLGMINDKGAVDWKPLVGAGQDFRYFVDKDKLLVVSSQSNKEQLSLIDLTSGKCTASTSVGEKWSTYKMDFRSGQTIIISKDGNAIQLLDEQLQEIGSFDFAESVWNFLSLNNGSTVVSVLEKGVFYKDKAMSAFKKCNINFTDLSRVNLFYCRDRALIESNWQHVRIIDERGKISPVNIIEGGAGITSNSYCNIQCQDSNVLYLGNNKHVMAIDLENRALLWSMKCDHDAFLAQSGFLVVFDKYTGEIGVFNGKTGKLQYGHHLGDFFYAFDRYGKARPKFPGIFEQGILYCSTGHNRSVVAIELSSGEVLWESSKLKSPCYSAMTVNGKMLFILDCRGRLAIIALGG